MSVSLMPKDRQLLFYLSVLIAWLIGCIVVTMVIFQNTFKHTQIQLSLPQSCNHGYLNCAYLKQSGLGNLLFQYASTYGVAKTKGMTLVTPDNFRLSLYFELPSQKSDRFSDKQDWYNYYELKANTYDDVLVSKLDPCHNSTLVGFLQSYKYFEHVQLQLATVLHFHEDISQQANDFLVDAASRIFRVESRMKVIFIGVHVRRGDMTSSKAQQLGYSTPGQDYYLAAIARYNSMFGRHKTLFVVSSDDIPWCEDHFDVISANVVYSKGNPDYLDLAILSRCNHSIISAGTFSWWSGWLSGGDVIYYSGFPKSGSDLAGGFSSNKTDYYPKNWVGIG